MLFDSKGIGAHHTQDLPPSRRQRDQQYSRVGIVRSAHDVTVRFQRFDGLRYRLPTDVEAVGQARGMQCATGQRNEGHRLCGSHAIETGRGERRTQARTAAGGKHVHQSRHGGVHDVRVCQSRQL